MQKVFFFINMYFYYNAMGSSTEQNFHEALSIRHKILLPNSLIKQIKLILYIIHLCKLKKNNYKRNKTNRCQN